MAVMMVIMRMFVPVVMVMFYYRSRTHCAPPSPFISTLSNSESELRMAVVLSSRIFL